MIDQRSLAWMVYIFLDKKSASNGDAKNEIVSNREINRVITKINYYYTKLQSFFKNNIWGADLSDMQLISNLVKEFVFIMCY